MTVHQFGGALAALEAAKLQQADEGSRDYIDLDHVATEGARSDGDDLEKQSLIKATRMLNDFVARVTIKGVHVDTNCDSPDYIQNGMMTWPTFKQEHRDLLTGLQATRKATVAGPMGGRTGSTTGSFETMTQETREQLHLANVPKIVKGKQVSVPAIVRWDYIDDRNEWNTDGSVARWPYWAVEPVVELNEAGEEIEVKAGVKHERANEPIVMWRLSAIYTIKDEQTIKTEFDALADAVHMAQQTVKQTRAAERKAALNPDNVENWTGTVEGLGL